MCAFCLDVIGSVCLCMWPRECVRIFLPNVYISASVFEFVWVGVNVCVCLSVSVCECAALCRWEVLGSAVGSAGTGSSMRNHFNNFETT